MLSFTNPVWLLVLRVWPFILKNRYLTIFVSLCLAAVLSPLEAAAVGTWTPLANPAPSGVGLMLLLSDGTVMCQNGSSWNRLTPDIHGSYVNGTWSTLAPMHDTRTYYSSQVLRDGRVFVAGGEYGSGKTKAEIYNPLSNTWTQAATPPDEIIDNISATLPNGNVLEGFPGQDCRIYDIVSNVWSAKIYIFDGQDEAEWVKLQDGSILTIDPFGTNTERFVPGLNKWVRDVPVTTPMYGYGGELGAGFLLPNGKAFFIGGTSHTSIYTPWTTNAAGIYTPNGATNAGTWTAGPDIPNSNAGVDAPAAMMVNGKILCCMTDTNNSFGNGAYYYEYDYVANAFTQISAPAGGLHSSSIAYGQQMLDLPDGTVLISGFGSQVYSYQPSGSPLASGAPTIASVTTNLDGSFHVTGTLFNGITAGAAYGDDKQMATSYPIARMTNAAGNTLYARTYNWSTCNVMTGTNLVTTEMTLPAGMLAGTYPLVITANGNASAPYALTISGTPLPPVANLGFTTVASSQMAFKWNAIGLTETGYVVQRSTDGTNYATLAVLGSGTTTFTDNAVSPLGQYYYRVLGTNSFGLGLAAPVIFAASPAVTPLPAPWQNRDVGSVLGSGASGTAAGTFTVIGSGTGMAADNDQFQFVYQPVVGDVTITARVTANQNTGSNSLAGVMIRSSTGFDVADALMAFSGGAQWSVFEHRATAAGLATYGLKKYGESYKNDAPEQDPAGGGGNGSPTMVTQPATAPLWVRLVRSGNSISGYTSTDGSTWTLQGTRTVVLPPTVQVGLAVTSGAYNQLNTSTFDNVTVTGTPAVVPPAMAEWKLDETSGTAAEDSIDSFDGLYSGVTLGLPGATPTTGYAAGFNGSSSSVSIPPLNLNSNVCTITAWVKRNGNQSANAGIFFDRESSTANGFQFGTANELRYSWANAANTWSWNSGLVPPSGQWAFVALVIEPTRARIYMAVNGVLTGATNNVANPVQGFAGTSYIGQDSGFNNRFFNGQLDEVQFFNAALTPAQLASMAAQPVIAITTPASGQEFLPPASITVTAAASAMSGHTLNLIQIFDSNGVLVGQSATSPCTATVNSLAAGTYSYSARMYYDSGLVVSANPVSVIVESAPAAPQNVMATALSSTQSYISWAPSAGADGYVLNRNGTPVATFGASTNYFVDTGLSPSTGYCYTVAATNLVGSSAVSASACITTPATQTALAWDAGSSAAGPQDGSDNWGGGAFTWWNGSAAGLWTDGSTAVFGSGTTSNCVVTLQSTVAPAGILFNPASGGAYTLTGINGNDLLLNGTVPVIANSSATISAYLGGSGALVKSGPGTLTLTVANTNTGPVIVNGGQLVSTVSCWYSPRGIGSGYLTVNSGATAEFTQTHGFGYGTGGQAATLNNGTLQLDHENYVSGLTMTAGTVSGAGEIRTTGGTYSILASASPSVIGLNVNFVSAGTFNVARGTGPVDLQDSGPSSGGGNFTKNGAGIMVISGAWASTGTTTVSGGTLQLDGSLGTGTVSVGSGAMLAGTGTLNGATTVASGGTLAPGDAGIGTISFNSSLTLNAGSKTALEIGKDGSGTLSGDFIFAQGALALNGTLTVTNLGPGALAAGDSFDLFNAGTVSGNFASVILPALGAGLGWNTSQLAVNGIITVTNSTSTFTLTYNAGPNGSISGTSPQTVSYGGSGSAVTAVANSGYHFVNWSDSSTANPRTDVNVTGSLTVTANFALNAVSGVSLTWDADSVTAGTQDGSGTWGGSGTNWQYGGANIPWFDGNTAVFGNGTTTNCTVTLASAVTPIGITFNATGGGSYTIAGASAIVLTNNAPFIANGNGTISAPINGTGGFTESGSGSLTLSGANSFSGGAAVNAGTLSLNNLNAIPFGASHSNLVVAAGATVVWNNNGNTGNGTSGNTGWNVNVAGAGTFDVSNASSVVTLSGNNTFSGTWRADATLALVFGNAAASQGAANLTVNGGSVLLGFNGVTTVGSLSGTGGSIAVNYNYGGSGNGLRTLSVNQVSNATYAGVIGVGDGGASARQLALVKNGSATLALAGANTFSGATTVNAGALLVDGSLAAGSAVTVTGGIVGGGGTINGPVTVQSSGTLAPGDNAIGTLTVSNSLTLAGATVMEISQTAGTSDLVQGVSVLTYGGTLTVTNLSGTLAAGDSFTLFSAASYAGSFSTINLPALGAGLAWDTTQLAVNGSISVAAVTYTLTYTAGPNGGISGTTPQTVSYGGSGTAVTATPNAGYSFVNWSDGSTANPRTDANVTNNVTVTANFAINTYTLTYLAGTNGSISGTTPQTVSYGGSGSAVTAVANSGYVFTNWSDGLTANPRTDANVTNNVAVTANFVAGASALPAPWTTNMVGSITAAVDATVSGGAYSITGGGANISGRSDNFWYVCQPCTNDVVMIARVVSQQSASSAAEAGVMIRETLAAGSRQVFMGLDPAKGARFIRRSSTGGTTSTTTSSGKTPPYWVQLQRNGNVFTGSISTDGVTWTVVSSVTVSMSTNAQIGFAVCSGGSSAANLAVFDNVSVTSGVPLPPPIATPQPPTGPATIADFSRVTDASDMTVTGNSGDVWMVETSPDLINWTPLETSTVINGQIQIEEGDPGTGGQPQQYYRLVSPP